MSDSLGGGVWLTLYIWNFISPVEYFTAAFLKGSVLIVCEYSDEYAKWTKKQFTVLCVSTGYEMKA